VCLARELDKLGYRVTMMCDCPEPGIKDGNIEYWHYSQYGDYVDQYWIDYFISSRTTDTLKFPVRAGKIYVMIHDIFLLSERAQLFPDKVTKYCVLSDWHRNFFSGYHGVSNDKIVNTANGIDFSRYDVEVERDPYRMFWSSSLDRGLDTLLYLFPFIKKEIPKLELHIFYGLFNWRKSAELRNDLEQLKKIGDLERIIANTEGVVFHDRVGQRELAIEQKKSSLWAFPTDFEEVFCITSIEAQRAGCPVIASNYAGLQTTIGKSGVLIGSGNKGESYTQAYRQEFLNKCIEILDDSQKWNEWSEKGFENTKKYSWANVALMWKKLFEE
jgi:glycosyltransferase involved in cell wall biosynthesis